MATIQSDSGEIELDVLRQQLLSWGLDTATADTALRGACSVREVLTQVLEHTTGSLATISVPRAVSPREPAPEDEPTEARTPANPWNAFQARLAGSGLSREQVREAYKTERAAVAGTRPTTQTTNHDVLRRYDVLPGSHGYDVLRAPASLRGLLGLHLCTWPQLMAKFGLTVGGWEAHRSGYYVPRFVDSRTSHDRWASQGLTGAVPVYQGPSTSLTSCLA